MCQCSGSAGVTSNVLLLSIPPRSPTSCNQLQIPVVCAFQSAGVCKCAMSVGPMPTPVILCTAGASPGYASAMTPTLWHHPSRQPGSAHLRQWLLPTCNTCVKGDWHTCKPCGSAAWTEVDCVDCCSCKDQPCECGGIMPGRGDTRHLDAGGMCRVMQLYAPPLSVV